MRIVTAAFLVLATFFGAAAPANAQAADESVFGFAGRYTSTWIDSSMVPLIADYEDNFVLGGGYQKFFFEPLPDLRVGGEIGVALRGGSVVSGEVWAGALVRFDGIVLGDTLRISPAITGGFSVVTNAIGVEAQRAQNDNADPTLLFFMAPEVSFATVDRPDTELFIRLQHRSGAWGTLGGMSDGANAQVIGIRHSF